MFLQNIFMLFLIILMQNADNVKSQCLNPNGQYGYCISLYECPSLISVAMKKPLTDLDVKFLRQAECYEGFGKPPLVCCNNDIGFYYSNFPYRSFNSQDPFQGTRFPDESPPPPLPPSPTNQRNNQFTNRNNPMQQFQQARSTGNSPKLPTPPQCGIDGISQKIYGGSDALLDEFPWMVLLIYVQGRSGQMTMNCGGSLINDRYVLTAAHCLKENILKKVGELKYIRLGEYDVTKNVDCQNNDCADPAVQVGIERLMPHENFKDNDMHRHNDIGLVKMDRSVQFSDYVRPICLPFMVRAESPRPGTNLIVAGWGRTLNARRATIKQKLTVKTESLEECSKKFRTKSVNIIDSQLCAGGVLREDSCDGDSGGPLMRVYKDSWILEGIVSFGIRCGFRDWPAVHTRVSSYENWIKNKIR